jgi:hypothetical protein
MPESPQEIPGDRIRARSRLEPSHSSGGDSNRASRAASEKCHTLDWRDASRGFGKAIRCSTPCSAQIGGLQVVNLGALGRAGDCRALTIRILSIHTSGSAGAVGTSSQRLSIFTANIYPILAASALRSSDKCPSSDVTWPPSTAKAACANRSSASLSERAVGVDPHGVPQYHESLHYVKSSDLPPHSAFCASVHHSPCAMRLLYCVRQPNSPRQTDCSRQTGV